MWSFEVDELCIWLKMIDVLEMGVSGMIFWMYLMCDYSFDLVKIEGFIEFEFERFYLVVYFGY